MGQGRRGEEIERKEEIEKERLEGNRKKEGRLASSGSANFINLGAWPTGHRAS